MKLSLQQIAALARLCRVSLPRMLITLARLRIERVGN